MPNNFGGDQFDPEYMPQDEPTPKLAMPEKVYDLRYTATTGVSTIVGVNMAFPTILDFLRQGAFPITESTQAALNRGELVRWPNGECYQLILKDETTPVPINEAATKTVVFTKGELLHLIACMSHADKRIILDHNLKNRLHKLYWEPDTIDESTNPFNLLKKILGRLPNLSAGSLCTLKDAINAVDAAIQSRFEEACAKEGHNWDDKDGLQVPADSGYENDKMIVRTCQRCGTKEQRFTESKPVHTWKVKE